MFTPQTYPLGTLKPTAMAEAVFLREPGGKAINHINVSCGCTRVDKHKPGATSITVVFTADYLPEGVKAQGKTSYEVTKYVTVVYADETFETLWLTATIAE